ncbi:FadR/GntR family transcriptional regulator [Paenibacillus sp. PAMC21692]|uniref:FadR/GntR family transcriptional regulator n=1 Tax=Paenibacillus sp. PAMC21692 TaxID=2762320 RepID=UPI00164DD4C2|nr:FCD domain-containing protein [Paenibacillus sp. PAMC21692]QNK59251.1 FadR family transcriptional regulator [Paenibacillus sp. PAMC21692]
MSLEPIVRTSLKEQAIAKIREFITDGSFRAGHRFYSEKELIERLEMSRTVIREALKSLETIGLLLIKPGDGIYVSEASISHIVNQVSFGWTQNPERMRELLETRVMLEKAALELIISRSQPIALDTLERINAQMAAAIENGESIIELDIAFHRSLFQLTGNATFQELSEVISAFFHDWRDQLLDKESGYITLRDHEEITQAIAKKNTAAAKTWLEHHLSVWNRLFER